jgi:multicomponent Na+:H+ antiporter subunit B
MNSLILLEASRLLKPLLMVVSVLVLFRGHNEPGGGFVGGLLAAAAFSLQAISSGVSAARRGLTPTS